MIEFTSDGSVTYEGFTLSYEVSDTPVQSSSDQGTGQGQSQDYGQGPDQGQNQDYGQSSGQDSGEHALPAACVGEDSMEFTNDSSGIIHSPADSNNDGNYYNNLRCKWMVYGNGYQVRIYHFKYGYMYKS